MDQGCFPGMEPKAKPEKPTGKKVEEWKVKSWTNPKLIYTVRREGSKWTCNCFYFTERKKECKHIHSVKEDLGLVKEDLSGFKSAIQKALRRGDLPLLKLAFSKLMESEPKWIGYRLPILAAEESWQYMGMAGRLSADPEMKREDAWKLLANIALHPKDKNAEGLNILADKAIRHNEDPKELIKDPERMAIFEGWMEIRKNFEMIDTDPETFWGWFNPGENEFAREIVRAARRRSKFGGMSGDKCLLFVAAYLASVTKVEPIELDEVPREEDAEAAKEIPWYCIDVHTGIGKIVYYQFKKMLGEDMGEYVGMELWFNLESARCNEMVADSYWWDLCLRAWARRRKKTLEQCKKDYAEWIPRIEERVRKILVARQRNGA